MRHYLYITEMGEAMTVNPTNDCLRDLQTLVGGLIECVPADPDRLGMNADVWVNEEGLFISGMGLNFVASYITGRQLVGPCVITMERGGKTIGLMPEHLRTIRADGMEIDTNGNTHYSPDEAAAVRF